MPGHGSPPVFGELRPPALGAVLFVYELLSSCDLCGPRNTKDQTLGSCFQRSQLDLLFGPAFRDGGMQVP